MNIEPSVVVIIAERNAHSVAGVKHAASHSFVNKFITFVDIQSLFAEIVGDV